jgi:predicted transposase YbfD/YdcC
VVAVDGKTVRRSGSRRHEHGPLHLVSAWASGRGLALGQREVDGKSNEIAAIPELLDVLRLDGCIVTLDAMGCQKGIAERIRAKGADYLLVLKANHGRAFEAVREHFERTCFGRGSGGRPVFDAFDEGHGRLVRRRVFASPAAKELEPLSGWPELTTVLAVETIRGVTGTGKVEAEIRYFLTSCGDDPAVLVRAIRRHWSVENALHWVSTSPSARMTAVCATAPPRATSPSCARSPSTSSPGTAAVEPAYAAGARGPPGTTTTCSRSSPTRLMREPWSTSASAPAPRPGGGVRVRGGVLHRQRLHSALGYRTPAEARADMEGIGMRAAA